MKFFLWLLTLTFILVSLTGWVMSELVERSIRDTMAALPIPYFTRLLIFPHGWLLVAPIPWIVYAGALTLRRELTPSAVFLFAGTLILFAMLLTCALVIALTLLYIPRLP
jgi:hypothetical protein